MKILLRQQKPFDDFKDGISGLADKSKMSATDNFRYDSEGHLIYDKSKGLKILYDWRGTGNFKNLEHSNKVKDAEMWK